MRMRVEGRAAKRSVQETLLLPAVNNLVGGGQGCKLKRIRGACCARESMFSRQTSAKESSKTHPSARLQQ